MKKRVKVDFDKLQKLLEKNNFKMSTISKVLGYSDQWLAQAKRQGSPLAETDIERMCILFGCSKDEIVLKEEKKAEPEKKNDDKFLNNIASILEEINNRTVTIPNRSADIARRLDAAQHRIIDLEKTIKEMNQRDAKRDASVSPLDFAMAFLLGVFDGADEVSESTIMQLAKVDNIDSITLQLAREQMGFAIITRMLDKKTKIRIWRRSN